MVTTLTVNDKTRMPVQQRDGMYYFTISSPQVVKSSVLRVVNANCLYSTMRITDLATQQEKVENGLFFTSLRVCATEVVRDQSLM